MSELSLPLVPPAELLNTAGPGPLRFRPDGGPAAATAPSNPFAALLAGVLDGTQSLAQMPGAGTALPALAAPAADTPDPGASPTLPATAEMPAPVALWPAGNALPAGGNALPLEDGADPVLATRTGPPPGTGPTPLAAEPQGRISLADLALTRPVEAPAAAITGTEPAEERAPGDGAAGPVANALRLPKAAATGNPDEAPAAPRLAPPAATNTTTPGPEAPVTLPQAGDRLALRLAGIDLARGPVPAAALTGGELLAGQVAAFAAGTDTGTPPAPAADTRLAGGAADATSLASRIAGTGLPPLQPLGDGARFAGGLADRLLTLAGPGTHTARLKLHPEQLGELDVEITLDDGTARVWFGASNPQAREAIENSLPRLKEMFAEQGVELTRAQVDSGGGQERRTNGGENPWSDVPAWQPGRAADRAPPVVGMPPATPARLLDVLA